MSQQLDKDWLWQFNKSQLVRKTEEKYQELLGALGDADNSKVDDLLRRNGYKDWTDFLVKCPLYPLSSRPFDLAALGSGFVLYFIFVRFMMVILFLYVFIQIPVWVAYKKADNLDHFIPASVNATQNQTSTIDWAKCASSAASLKAGLTPGSLGYQSGFERIIPVMYAVGSWIFAVLTAIQSQLQRAVDQAVDHCTSDPSDFAVLVEGLPKTVTSEDEIADFFRKHSVSGPEVVEVVKVVIHYESEWVVAKAKELKELRAKLAGGGARTSGVSVFGREAPLSPAEMSDACQKLERELATWEDATTHESQIKPTGMAIVVFRTMDAADKCLKRWDSWLARSFGYEWKKGNCCWYLDTLPPFPGSEADPEAWKHLSVTRAPDPTDINWNGLGKPLKARLKRRLVTLVVSLLVLLVSFAGLVGITFQNLKEQQAIRNAGGYTKDKRRSGMYMVMVILLIVINLIQVAIIRKFGEREYHKTRTALATSQNLTLTLAMFVNAAMVLLIMNPTSCTWYQDSRLVDAVTSKLAINIFMPLLTPLLDFELMGKWFKRRCLGGQKLDEVNKAANEAQDWAAKKLAAEEVEKIKDIFTPTEMDLPYQYANAQNTFLMCVFYLPLVPLAALMGFLGLGVQYFVDKWMLLRYCRTPSLKMNSSLAMDSLENLRFIALILLPLTVLLFLLPSWKPEQRKALTDGVVFMAIPAIIMWLIPLDRLACCFRPCCVKIVQIEHNREEIKDFYKAQRLWMPGQRYHKTQPVYRLANEDLNPADLNPGSKSLEVKEIFVHGFDGSQEVVPQTNFPGAALMSRRLVQQAPHQARQQQNVGGPVAAQPVGHVVGVVLGAQQIPQQVQYATQTGMYQAQGATLVYQQQPMVYQQQPMVYQQQPMVYQQQPMVYQQQPMVYQQQPMVYVPGQVMPFS